MHQNEHTLVLIVDDNPTNCELLHRRLTRQGYSCEVAYSGKQMLETIEQTRPNLVLLDLMMPEMDGLEVLRILRESYSSAELPVLMVTARNAREDVVSAFEAGANDYIEKPIDFPVLLARLKHQLEHKRLQDDAKKNRTQLKERSNQWQKANHQKNELLKMLSAELRSPLSQILSDLSQLAQPVNEATREALTKRAQARALHVSRIAEDLHDLAQLEANQLELKLFPADLYVLINNIVTTLQKDADRRGILLEASIDESLGVIECDPIRLPQIIVNLLGNAINVSPPGTKIEMQVSLTASGSIRICVQDSGATLSTSDPEMIFSPFLTATDVTHDTPVTTGLALYLVSKLVSLSHGLIEVEPLSPNGNRFLVYLPYRPVEFEGNQ